MAAIEATLAGEPALRDELRLIRRAHDDLEAEVDQMVRKGARADQLAPRQEEVSRLAAAEVVVAQKLAAIPAARAALEALLYRRADALREADGPLGDDLRALDGAI